MTTKLQSSRWIFIPYTYSKFNFLINIIFCSWLFIGDHWAIIVLVPNGCIKHYQQIILFVWNPWSDLCYTRSNSLFILLLYLWLLTNDREDLLNKECSIIHYLPQPQTAPSKFSETLFTLYLAPSRPSLPLNRVAKTLIFFARSTIPDFRCNKPIFFSTKHNKSIPSA